jgi:hypothetical protein
VGKLFIKIKENGSLSGRAVDVGVEFELDEVQDFAKGIRTQASQHIQDFLFPALGCVLVIIEKLTNFQTEDPQNPEKRIERDFVLAILHSAEVGLLNSDFRGQNRLGQSLLLSDLPYFRPGKKGLPFASSMTGSQIHDGFLLLTKNITKTPVSIDFPYRISS